ncbi:MAG: hypothetical protein V1871_08145 [Planctomycetota bacterium]
MKQTTRFTCPTLPFRRVRMAGQGFRWWWFIKRNKFMLCVTLRIAQQSNMFGLLDAVMGYREKIFFSLRPHILRGINLADRSILTI